MKRTNYFFLVVAALGSLSLFSCNNLDEGYYEDIFPKAVVTVKTADDGSVFLQLDDATTLQPANITAHPFDGKEVRAFTNYRTKAMLSGFYNELVHVNWIDSIRTKNPVQLVEGGNAELYGSAPVEIVDDWITSVEDGYLTLHLLIEWYAHNKKHYINLLTGGNPDDPYEVELRHDAEGEYDGIEFSDGSYGYGGYGYGGHAYVAFRLDGLPDTEGETVKLKLKWQSPRGNRSAEFDYRTRN